MVDNGGIDEADFSEQVAGHVFMDREVPLLGNRGKLRRGLLLSISMRGRRLLVLGTHSGCSPKSSSQRPAAG